MASGSSVRSAVRRLLQSSPSYRGLAPDERREVAHDTIRVASYMADPHGLLSKKPRSDDGAATAHTRAAATRAPAKGSRASGPAAAPLAVLSDPRVLDSSAAIETLLQQVDFPDFVGDLIQGVFHAIVDASIQQMQAYAGLIKQVCATVDRFVEDGISTAQARDWLAHRFASHLELDPRGRLRWCVDPEHGARALAAALSMPGAAVDLQGIVAAARRRIAIDRQQVLATMVMMAINRLVVSDGKQGA